MSESLTSDYGAWMLVSLTSHSKGSEMRKESETRVPIRPVYKEFGQRVKIGRGTSKLTQDMLAHQIGLSRTSITNIESGKQAVLLHQVYDIAKALDTTVQTLLPAEEPAEEISSPSVDDSIPEGVRRFLNEELGTAARKVRQR
jgi:DNA-binding XRE family transcriptional regulator